jgi:hypothetical protein
MAWKLEKLAFPSGMCTCVSGVAHDAEGGVVEIGGAQEEAPETRGVPYAGGLRRSPAPSAVETSATNPIALKAPGVASGAGTSAACHVKLAIAQLLAGTGTSG